MDQTTTWGQSSALDQPSVWQPSPTPPSLTPPHWQRLESSQSVQGYNYLDHAVSEPQAGPEIYPQQLVAGLDPAKIQEVAASQVVISERYCATVQHHAQRLFRWALMAAGAGLLFFLLAIALLVFKQSVTGTDQFDEWGSTRSCSPAQLLSLWADISPIQRDSGAPG